MTDPPKPPDSPDDPLEVWRVDDVEPGSPPPDPPPGELWYLDDIETAPPPPLPTLNLPMLNLPMSSPPIAPSPSPPPPIAPPPTPPPPPRAADPRPRPRPPATDGGPRLDVDVPLPNAMVGRAYDATVRLKVRKASGLRAGARAEDLMVGARRIDGLDRIGLEYQCSGDQIRVHGTPIEAGDHPVTIALEVLDRGQAWAPTSARLTLTVNPDPRSLWKEIEPDPSLPDRRPHLENQRIDAGDHVLIAASRRGRSHANKGENRDDAFALDHDRGWSVLALADGAGSAPLSRRGAELACETARAEVRKHFATTLGDSFAESAASLARAGADSEAASRRVRTALYQCLGGAGNQAFRRIVAEASGRGRPPEEFATTLILTIARKYDFGWFVAAIAVGDGGAAILRPGEVYPLNRPDSGDFAGQTRFLTMPQIWADGKEINERILFQIVPDLTAVVAMTDGVSDPKFASDRAFQDPGRWGQFWGELTSEAALAPENERADVDLLEWLNFWAVGHHDDRTIALLLPKSPTAVEASPWRT